MSMQASSRSSLMIVLAAVMVPWGVLFPQSTAIQSVSLEVRPVTKIAVSGNPGSLIISDATAGLPDMSVQDNTTSYSITTNLDAMKIVASIDNPMPAGTRLELNIASISGASAGLVDVSNASSPVNVVTGINKGVDASQTITYVFSADAEAGGISPQSRVITLTLTN